MAEYVNPVLHLNKHTQSSRIYLKLKMPSEQRFGWQFCFKALQQPLFHFSAEGLSKSNSAAMVLPSFQTAYRSVDTNINGSSTKPKHSEKYNPKKTVQKLYQTANFLLSLHLPNL
jgi:hypothetical protein